MKQRLTILLASLFLFAGAAMAQTTVTGTVVAQDDGQPLAGAAIRVVGNNSVGTVTDVDGKFAITLPAGYTKINVTYVGMQPQELTGRGNMRIALVSDQENLDEVMVVAFGTAKKSAYTGSATVINSEQLAESQVSSITNALQGAVPGLQLTSANGAPGSTSTIRIRGFSSINAGKDPLIILDGAPYSGDLANLNPADVESMTVLKDAASNALYGARGANGVIIITTKKAKKLGEATVNLDLKTGWNSRALQHYDVITDPAEYYEMQYTALNNYWLSSGYSATESWQLANKYLTSDDYGGLGYNIWTVPTGQSLIGTNGRLNPNATLGRLYTYNGEEYWVTPDDWEDIGTRIGNRQEYNLSVSAANERGNFFASVGYLNEEGITYKSDLERFTGRLKADYQAKKWLKVGANLSFSHFSNNSLDNNGSSTSTGNIWAYLLQMAPVYPAYVRNGDGSIKVDENGIKVMDYGASGNSYTNAGLNRAFISDANPIQDNLLDTYGGEGNAASATGFADIEFIPGLKLTINGTYTLDETRFTYVYNPYYGQFNSTGGTVGKEHYRVYEVNLQQILNYTTTFAEKHNLNVMVGHEYYNYKTYDLYGWKRNMFSQTNKELNGAVVDTQGAGSSTTRYNNEGYFGRALYDYKDTYFFQASIRRDASSRFDPDHRWGTFWSVGAAWRLGKESWFNADWVDELKVKASVGSQGNDNISSYLYTDTYTLSNSNDDIGITFNSKGTEDLTWETNTNWNVGAEFSFWKKLTGSLEFYYRKTSDMLFSFSVAPSLGYSAYYDNIGDLYNSGFELTLNYDIFSKRNLRWDVNLNIASLRNRITMLPDDKKTTGYYDLDGKYYEGYVSGNFMIAEDLPLYTWRLKEYAGVDHETGEALWYMNEFDDDGNWTGVTTTNDWSEADYYVNNETTIPDFYGGFGTSVYVYGFDFSINCSFQLGGKQYDSTYARFMSAPSSSSSGYNFHKDLYNSWTPENTESNIPAFIYADGFQSGYANAASTRWLTNASYLSIENINVGYTLPDSWTHKLQLEKLRIYLSMQNVAYFSARKGFDPRQSYSSTTNATYYSPMRTVSLGLNLSF